PSRRRAPPRGLLLPPALPGGGRGLRAGRPAPVARRGRPLGRLHPRAPGGARGRMSAEPVLSARGLHVTFPGRRGGQPARAVDGVNLDVHPSEILALVGESGCGKTTLARTLMGLERPSAGEVRFADVALDYSTRSLRAYRRRVQLVLQDPTGSLNPRHSVYEAVAEGLRIHGSGALGSFGGEEAKVADALSRPALGPPVRFFAPY